MRTFDEVLDVALRHCGENPDDDVVLRRLRMVATPEEWAQFEHMFMLAAIEEVAIFDEDGLIVGFKSEFMSDEVPV